MGTASIHEGVRRMRFSSLLERTAARELTQGEASELLGINVRTFQRWADRYEAEGDDGLGDLPGCYGDSHRNRHRNYRVSFQWCSPGTLNLQRESALSPLQS